MKTNGYSLSNNDARLDLLARVASLYYDKQLSQNEIADLVGMSRSAISRLLTEAQSRGIVEHIVHYPLRTAVDLEKALTSAFGLRHVVVLQRQNKTQEEMLHGIGALAAEYFTSLLPTLHIAGITWGTGLFQMVRAMRPQSYPNMEIIQLIGGTGYEYGSEIGPLLAPALASRLGARVRLLNAPLIMQNVNTHQALMNDPAIHETLRRAELCDVALIGIGSTLPDLYNVYKTGYLSLEETEKLRNEGIIGDICGLHFNSEGEILMDHWINQRIVTVRPDSLRKIKAVMALAGGERKADSIYAALRGRHIHILVTDDLAARRVLELHKAHPGD